MIADHSFWIQGPAFTINLPCIDACHPVHYVRRLLIFHCDSAAQRATQIAALKQGLQVLVQRCPLLAGTIDRPAQEQGRQNLPDAWRTIVPGEGLELLVRDLSMELPSLKLLEASNFQSSLLPYECLMPFPQNMTGENLVAACKVQYTGIEGGSIFTFAMSHSVGDGGATNELLRILSEAVCHAQDDSTLVEITAKNERDVVGLNRSHIRNLNSDEPFDMDQHPGYCRQSTYSQIPTLQNHPFTATAPEVPIIMTIPANKLAQLKKDATPSNAAWISTHDALAALMWCIHMQIRRHRSKAAAQLADSTPCSIFMPSDARRHLGLPPSYLGNVVYQLAATLPLGTILAPNGLQSAAAAVRQAITHATPACVKSLIAKSNDGWIDWSFPNTMLTTGLAMGTDWTSSDLFEHDWGPAFGSLLRFRYPNAAFNCVMPKLPNDSAELLIAVMPAEVETLRELELCAKYFTFLADESI